MNYFKFLFTLALLLSFATAPLIAQTSTSLSLESIEPLTSTTVKTDYKSVVQKFYKTIINSSEFDQLPGFLAPDFVERTPLNELQPGTGLNSMTYRTLKKSFPDLKVTVESIMAEGNTVIALVRMEGTHTGDYLGYPVTLLPVKLLGCDVFRFNNEMIVEHWGFIQESALMKQIGAVQGGYIPPIEPIPSTTTNPVEPLKPQSSSSTKTSDSKSSSTTKTTPKKP